MTYRSMGGATRRGRRWANMAIGLATLLMTTAGWTTEADAADVCFYADRNYQGREWCVPVGTDGRPQFGSLRNGDLAFDDNAIDSIRVPSSNFHGIWLYQHFFQGEKRLITRSVADLGTLKNQVSSWVIRHPGPAGTKVRYFVREVKYDGRDPDGAGPADHLLWAKSWMGTSPTWKPLISTNRKLSNNTTYNGWGDQLSCSGGPCNYQKDKGTWQPAVVQDWNRELAYQKEIVFSAWDCAGTCRIDLKPNQWRQKPPCATGKCEQSGSAGVYPLGDMILDLTKVRQWETVTLESGPTTVEVEVWKNPYFNQARRSYKDPAKVSLVGSTRSYTPAQFADYVAGMRFTNDPATEGAYTLVGNVTRLVPGQCTVVYPNAQAGGRSASVDLGELTCAVELADGVTLSVTPVYGGCNIAVRGGGRERECEIGVFRTSLTVEHTIPGCGEQICEFETELEVNGPNAHACDTVTYDSYCQSVGADLVTAEISVRDGNGNGVGAGVGVGVGAGAAVSVDDGVLQTSIELKALAGGEITFSIGYEENAKLIYRLGEKGIAYAASNKYMGKRFADVHRHMPGSDQREKAFAGITKVRQFGRDIRLAKYVDDGLTTFARAFDSGTWKSAGDFFGRATSWIPKF